MEDVVLVYGGWAPTENVSTSLEDLEAFKQRQVALGALCVNCESSADSSFGLYLRHTHVMETFQ